MSTPSSCRYHGFHGTFERPNATSHPESADAAPSAWDACKVSYQGHLANAPALRRELGLSSETPTEHVLATGWTRWARGLFARLDGVFAVAIHSRRGLWLFRARSGLANLYYRALPGGRVGFATSLRALLAHGDSTPRIDRSALHEYLHLLDIAAPRTIYQGIRAVEPGHVVFWSNEHTSPLSDSTLQEPATVSPTSLEEAVEHSERLLLHTVETLLENAERPAAFLSGGIDSALICAAAVRSRRDLVAVTVSFDDPAVDEAQSARQIADHLGLRHRALRFDHVQYVQAFERLAHFGDQPMADPSTPATILALDRCRQDFDVVLDGTGADEAVGWMPPRHVRVAVEHVNRLPQPLRRIAATTVAVTPGLHRYAPLVDFEHAADTMTRWHGFTRSQIARLCGDTVDLSDTTFHRTFAKFKRTQHFERYSALLNSLPCDRVTQAMWVSDMPMRFPFAAADLDAYLRGLCTEYRHAPSQPKRLLRQLLARHCPPSLWDRPKQGFTFPLRPFLAADDHALVRRYLNAGFWRGRDLLRPEGVQAALQAYGTGNLAAVFQAWALVVLGAWLEAHG